MDYANGLVASSAAAAPFDVSLVMVAALVILINSLVSMPSLGKTALILIHLRHSLLAVSLLAIDSHH
jgi:hypothetical protein